MAWTTPRTWVASEVVSASLMNTHIRDNLNYLLSGRVTAKNSVNKGSDTSTTSATFGDVDAVNYIITATPQSTRMIVVFTFTATNPSATAFAEFDIISSSLATRAGEATHGLTVLQTAKTSNITLVGYFSGLTAGASQSFKLQYRSTTAGQTATVSGVGVPVSMYLMEV